VHRKTKGTEKNKKGVRSIWKKEGSRYAVRGKKNRRKEDEKRGEIGEKMPL